jgi:RTX calcium-binding nonapeptide repeat (4 copies)
VIVLRVAAITLAALAALPAVSYAASASVDEGKRWVVFEAGPGERNRLVIEVSTSSRTVRLSDTGVGALTAGPGCQTDPAGRVVCQLDERVRLVQADLGDGADRADVITANLRAAQVNVKGGSSDDVIRGRGPSRLDFSGDEGDDLLLGSEGPDILRGQDGNDFLNGRGGGDLLIGDVGDDVLRAYGGRDRLFGGAGADKLDARDTPALADSVVHCGPGRDLSTQDRVDRPKTRACEAIR